MCGGCGGNHNHSGNHEDNHSNHEEQKEAGQNKKTGFLSSLLSKLGL